jgi:hypothetical protein
MLLYLHHNTVMQFFVVFFAKPNHIQWAAVVGVVSFNLQRAANMARGLYQQSFCQIPSCFAPHNGSHSYLLIRKKRSFAMFLNVELAPALIDCFFVLCIPGPFFGPECFYVFLLALFSGSVLARLTP